MIAFHLQSIQNINWDTVNFDDFIHQLEEPYFWASVFTALFVCLGVTLLYYRYKIDNIKQIQHRQKLVRMILQNHWYESEQVQSDGFFKDLQGSKSKEEISCFPKIYYRLKDGLIHIRVEITMCKYQDQLLQLEKKLETGLYCELVDKESKDSYIEYTLLYDTIANRISIEDAIAENGRLKLMESVYWDYDKLPHMLIAGGTGGGKSYYILTIIEGDTRQSLEVFNRILE